MDLESHNKNRFIAILVQESSNFGEKILPKAIR